MTYPLNNLIRKNDIDKNIVEEVYIILIPFKSDLLLIE